MDVREAEVESHNLSFLKRDATKVFITQLVSTLVFLSSIALFEFKFGVNAESSMTGIFTAFSLIFLVPPLLLTLIALVVTISTRRSRVIWVGAILTMITPVFAVIPLFVQGFFGLSELIKNGADWQDACIVILLFFAGITISFKMISSALMLSRATRSESV
ncbi:MAG TPA: hypothetical protein PLQ19_05485 [Aeromicrobium sp.]|nr:hypothetical protein [Aeromicrobium sp.]